MNKLYSLIVAVVFSCVTLSAFASQATITNTFSSGTPAVASEVNDNFSGMKTAIDDNDARIATLESTIATLQSTISTLQSQLAAVNSSQVMALEPYLTIDTTTDSRGPLVQLSGVNLQIVNGTSTTDGTPNGLGNVIIGYDTVRNDATYRCSNNAYIDQSTCEANGATWAVSLKNGSHYLIIGDQNDYSQYGGIVVGYRNSSTGIFSSVTGGSNNNAIGDYSIVNGGNFNSTKGTNSSIGGGYNNITTGLYSSISGGSSNGATGIYSSISGGWYSTASGGYSSISGGYHNIASGNISSVSGGNTRSAPNQYNWAAGSLLEAN